MDMISERDAPQMLGSRARLELEKLWTSIRLGLTPPERLSG